MVLFQGKVLKQRQLSERLQLQFLEQLEQFLTHGYSLLESLERIKWDKRLASTANILTKALKKGLAIDQAFTQVHFHYTITSYLYFVRNHGDLLASIHTCQEMFAKRLRYRRSFQQIMRYPIILFVIFSLILIFLRQAILPTFINIFATSSLLPASFTYALLTFDLILPILVIFIIGSLVVIMIFMRQKSNLHTSTQVKIYQRIPFYRSHLKRETSFQIATHLSALIQTGMPLKDILAHMSRQDKLPLVAYYTSLMLDTLNKGYQISLFLSQCYFIEYHMADIFRNNNDKQSLANDLAVYANRVSEEMHRKMMSFLQIIQPLFFIILGVFIVFVYLILMWPMFQLIKQL